ncbi:MAG: glutamine--fructose-6-phosphate transaminase (isomerizing) [Candidatus Aenigmarchaeota archaeon]|nr:glutamine--fructose-6-phosphate transaminase (isomerizing) [Candidatus Aenigmarchaeota archaeon]
MCGILGIFSFVEPITIEESLKKLKNLEYRGYDSVGFATIEGYFNKHVGTIDSFLDSLSENEKSITTKCIILHTRWATHGGVTKNNSHPHFDCKKEIFVVHNGIIENYKEMKEELIKKGHKFVSETDTEVIAHLIEEMKDKSDKEILLSLSNMLDGTYAILIIFRGRKKILFLKKESPLVIGVAKNKVFVSSDIYAFLNETNRIITLNDGEFGIIDNNGIVIFDENGNKINKRIKVVKRFLFAENDNSFEHYMLKEILEQPRVSEILINSLETEQNKRVNKLLDAIKSFEKIVFIAAGSSYHSSLIGSYLLRSLEYNAFSVLASEYKQFFLYDKGTLLIPVSQSGETMDVILALKDLKNKVGDVFSIVNVPYSTIQRISSNSIEILAGQEKAVAATKTYTNQLVLFYYIANSLGLRVKIDEIPLKIDEAIKRNREKIIEIANELTDPKDIFIIGRDIDFLASLEIALKLKEIAYKHAEAFAAGELKHGTIALIEKGTPVIVLHGFNDLIESNTKEVESRGAKTVVFGDDLYIPLDDLTYPIYHVVLGQLLTYYIAKNNNLPIDKPRNLAKSVTVV